MADNEEMTTPALLYLRPCRTLRPLDIQFGRECWCGKSDMFEDYDRHGEGICDYKCAGDRLELCGELVDVIEDFLLCRGRTEDAGGRHHRTVANERAMRRM